LQTKNPPTILPAGTKDLDAIAEIEEKCFPKPTAYSRRQLAYLAFKANSTCLVEKQDDIIRGFVIVVYRRSSLKGWIETLNVNPQFQGQGVGASLLKAVQDEMRKRGKTFIQLEVSKGNTAAINLYTKAGYKIKQDLPNYYKHPHQGTRNAICMIKQL
jgi:[ribosomal protein S18]-alanine N-acetyltransferase